MRISTPLWAENLSSFFEGISDPADHSRMHFEIPAKRGHDHMTQIHLYKVGPEQKSDNNDQSENDQPKDRFVAHR